MKQHVLDYLEETVKEVPEKIAFSGEHSSLTFQELYDNSKRIGSNLILKGFVKEPVLVFMEKSPEEICTFFGVIRSGCFYVPIDEEMPATRIDLIIENCKPRVVIFDDATKEKVDTLNFSGKKFHYTELLQGETDEVALRGIYETTIDTDPIYIVFTSGSTGVPKGVVACHRSVIDYVEHLSEVLGFNRDTVFGNQSPLYFDACLKELYPTIMFGATTHLIPRELFAQPKNLVEYLNEKKVNTICWVVSALTMISAFKTFDLVKPQYLHTIAFGSEVFQKKQYRIWREALPEATFTNLYGPTEATGMSCYFRCDRELSEEEPIPIGRPFKNTQVLLLDENGKIVPKGQPGEICLRGTCVTLGYYNNPEKTSEAFVQNPLNPFYPELIYRTGDMGYYNEYKELVFASRKDYQIKHMGHRIELGEIEANVAKIEGVKICACTYQREKDKIVLHYVGDMDEKDLKTTLKDKLPRYMLPAKVNRMEEMCFTPNGKIDRKKLETL